MELAENTTLGAPPPGDWLTVPEFAALLNCEPVTIYEAIKADEIPGVIRIGRRRGLRIPRASYPVYVKSRLVTTSLESESAPIPAAA